MEQQQKLICPQEKGKLRVVRLTCYSIIVGTALALTGCFGLGNQTTEPPATPTPAPPSPVVSPVSPSPASSPAVSQNTNKPEAVKSLEGKIGITVGPVIGVPVQTVNCPAQIEVKARNRFDCEGTADGKSFVISIELTDDNGQFNWSTKQLLLMPRLEAFIQRRIKEKSGIEVTATCGGKLRVAKPGNVFECKVLDAQNQARSARVTVKDEQGSVDISLQS